MNHIPIQWLQALVEFADSKDMSQAAQRLGITQPALSKQLKSLQSLLPMALFMTQGKHKVLTPYGQDLCQQLRPRFQGLEEGLRSVELQHSQGAPPQIRIGARREVLDRVAGALTTTSTLILMESHHLDILQALKLRQIDIGITYAAPDSDQLLARSLFREAFQIVLPKSLVRLDPEGRWPEVLEKHPCLAYRESDEILQQAARFLKIDPMTLKVSRITANYLSLQQLVQAGRGWGILPYHSGSTTSGCWVLPLPSKALPTREFFAIYRKELSRNRWMKDVLTELAGAFKS